MNQDLAKKQFMVVAITGSISVAVIIMSLFFVPDWQAFVHGAVTFFVTTLVGLIFTK